VCTLRMRLGDNLCRGECVERGTYVFNGMLLNIACLFCEFIFGYGGLMQILYEQSFMLWLYQSFLYIQTYTDISPVLRVRTLQIFTPWHPTEAFAEGKLKPGDVLFTVDGTPVYRAPLNLVARKLLG
jgi:hypothetical protein